MPKHPGFFTDSIGNQAWYRCLSCRYDSFSAQGIREHCSFEHPKELPEAGISTQDWIASKIDTPIGKKRFVISLLTWNTVDASVYAAKTISQERYNLFALGIDCHIVWVDNGSVDGTKEQVGDIFTKSGADCQLNTTNVGQSRARNQIIAAALKADCDYLMMVDGDIQIVPYSTLAFARFLEDVQEHIGCVGMYCRNCTHVPDAEVASSCRKIEPWMVDPDPLIAWTNYGMFRRQVLETCQFEERGPFSGPGWGFEDDDYQMQMTLKGWTSVNTKYFRHLHRRRHSSVKLIGSDLAAKVYQERKAYLLEKWKGIPHVEGRLRLIENMTMPVLEY